MNLEDWQMVIAGQGLMVILFVAWLLLMYRRFEQRAADEIRAYGEHLAAQHAVHIEEEVDEMAIDGEIYAVDETDAHYILYIVPTTHSDGHQSIRGQSRLLLKKPAHPPVPGQIIWGGAGQVIIEPPPGSTMQRKFRRVGYTELEEVAE